MIAGKFLVFECQERKYAIELHRAKEVRMAENIIPMPGMDQFTLGVFNLRGVILNVKDLGRILHQEDTVLNEQSVLLHLEIPEMKTTIVVDALIGICSSDEVEWNSGVEENELSKIRTYFTWKEELIPVLSVDKIAA